MASNRRLPVNRNPLLGEDAAPTHEILVERRCLGQTELKVRPGQVGTTNATKPNNLGVLDYAHLRVPLPKDLSDSGIFTRQANRKWPESYFLMRRSSDGFISATGMFKAAFPWAQQDEEAAEKEYIKSLDATSSEEVAGNVWIHPDQALNLAEEYGIRLWIAALLDAQPITHGTNTPGKKAISSPPPYNLTAADMVNGTDVDANTGKTPKSAKKGKADGRRSTRGAKGSTPESPTKKTPSRKMATPRKPRKAKGKSVEPEGANGDAETVKVEVPSETKPAASGDEEKPGHSYVNSLPSLPSLENLEFPSRIYEQAKTAVDEVAAKISSPSTTKKGKRKADEMTPDDDDPPSPRRSPATKRARVAPVEVRRQRIKRRAFTGIVATVAIGALVPSLMAAFGS